MRGRNTNVHQVEAQAPGGRNVLAVRKQEGHVVLDFGQREISFVVFTPQQALDLAAALQLNAMMIDGRSGGPLIKAEG